MAGGRSTPHYTSAEGLPLSVYLLESLQGGSAERQPVPLRAGGPEGSRAWKRSARERNRPDLERQIVRVGAVQKREPRAFRRERAARREMKIRQRARGLGRGLGGQHARHRKRPGIPDAIVLANEEDALTPARQQKEPALRSRRPHRHGFGVARGVAARSRRASARGGTA